MDNGVDPYAFYNGITTAETGSFKDPWIRTVARNAPGGSTAFGPAQLTYTTASDYAGRPGVLTPKALSFFKTTMQPMYENFKKYGNEKNLPPHLQQFDYGGNGGFDPQKYAADYEDLVMQIQAAQAREAGGDVFKQIERWRGKPQSVDPRYYTAAMGAMNE